MDRILTADDKARDLGFADYRDWLRRGFTLYPLVFQGRAPKWTGETCKAPSVTAYINGGRWLAKCGECGSIEDVTPADPIFWCHRCGCSKHAGCALPVVFPKNIEAVEATVLARPVQDGVGFSDNDRAAGATPLAGLRRDWTPEQSLADVRRENKGAGL